MAASSSTSLSLSYPSPKSEQFLFPKLARIHLLPGLPEALHGLTFPELLTQDSFRDTNRLLEEYRELSPLIEELQQAYQELPSKAVRLFALFSKEGVSFFSIPKKIGELVSLGLYPIVGGEQLFKRVEVVKREVAERIFGSSPLFSNLKKVRIEECTSFAALESWIVPALEQEGSDWGSSSESEGVLSRAFEEAYKSKNVIEQLSLLEKLARIYLNRENYIIAAHLLNGACAVSESPSYRRLTLSRLEEIEKLFVSKKAGKELSPDLNHSIAHHRKVVQQNRIEVSRLLEEERPIKEVQAFLTKSCKELLTTLIHESAALLGPLPEGFAVMGLGSMARGETSPYSDVEFAFLVRDPSPENLGYCRLLDQLLAIKMVNMGETKFPLIRSEGESLVPTGFSMDIGGICPSGKPGIYELIGTPHQLAEFQKEGWLRENDAEIILVNAMTTVCYVMGDEDLVATYRGEIARILNGTVAVSSSSSQPSQLRKQRALELMRGYVEEFQPRLNQDKIDLRGFDVKKELYRPLQTVISGLALYYGLEANNTFEQIDALLGKGLFSIEGAHQLKQTIRTVFGLRIQAHLFYRTEREILYYSIEEGEKDAEGLFTINYEISQEIVAIYKRLIPFYEKTVIFLNGNEGAFSSFEFNKSTLDYYDDGDVKIFSFSSEDKEGELYANGDLHTLETLVALNPDDPFLRWRLVDAQLKLGQGESALVNINEVVSLEARKGRVIDIRAKLNALGRAYSSSNNHSSAAECYHTLLKINTQIHEDRPHPDIADNLNNLGNTYCALGEYARAIEYHEQSLTMKKHIYSDQPHPDIAASLNNLGNAYHSLGDYARAIGYHEQSLTMKKHIYSDQPHLDIAAIFNNLGNAYHSLGDYARAIEYHEQSLTMKKHIYSDQLHPDIANSLNNLGNAYHSLGEYARAIKCYEQSLAMERQLYGDRPRSCVASSLDSLGSAYHSLGEYARAIEYHEQSLTMQKNIYIDQFHPDIAASLNNLGNAYRALGETTRAIECYEESLAIQKQHYSDRLHPDIAMSLGNLGSTYFTLGTYSKAVECFQSSYEICAQTIGIDHPNSRSVKNLLRTATIANRCNNLYRNCQLL